MVANVESTTAIVSPHRRGSDAERAETAALSFLVAMTLAEALSAAILRPTAFQTFAYGVIQTIAVVGLVVTYVAAARDRRRIEAFGSGPAETDFLAKEGRPSFQHHLVVSVAVIVVLAGLHLINTLTTH